MKTKDKIIAAKARILELETLINLWEKQKKSTKTSNSSYI
tara:strand:- start:670 stop:789 length:120 start_codon:yes stop_codon:yes gene_type:complete